MTSESSMLFRVFKENPNDCHYIFGTMHMDNEDAYTFAELAKKYIDVSSFYYAEMDMSSFGGNDLGKYFMFQDGSNLQQLIKKSQYIKMRKIILKVFGLDIDLLNTFIPFYIQTLLSEIVLNSRNGRPLDYFLWRYASQNNKILGGVESVEDQLSVLLSIPMEVQMKSLRTICKNTKKFKRTLHAMSLSYKNGDLRNIYKMSKKQLGSLRKLMLIDRNQKMTNNIIEKLKLGLSFFAVGAAHLYGNSGILNKLKKSGFKVIPIWQ